MRHLPGLFLRLLAGLDFLLLTSAMLLLAILPKRYLSGMVPGLFQSWCRSFIALLGVRLNVHQHYHGELPECFVLIANHPSAFEDIGVPALFRARSLAKAEVADWPLLGTIAVAAGTLFVKRESAESRKLATQALITSLKDGHSVALYPEGGCKGRRLAPHFFNGAFIASREAGKPILPLFLHYQAQADFEWAEQTLPRKIWQIATASNASVDYHIFEPIAPDQFDSVEAMKAHVHARYLDWQTRFLE